ncbi:hypothetical protein MJH12_05980, partial [bacterium]|nr:hypothetical protein [bacterium]
MKFILKTEASRSIGFGHLKRLEVLATELIARGHQVLFIHFFSQEYMSDLEFESICLQEPKDFATYCFENDVLLLDEPAFPKSHYSYLDSITSIGIDELSDLRYHLDVHICSTLLGL